MKVLAIIPARGGSKGIPKKNIKLLNGKPLIYYSIDVAKKAIMIDRVVVSTDSKEIAAVAKIHGAEVIDRPSELATDEAPTEPSLIHAVRELEKSGYKPDYIMLLQPTSPLRDSKDIDDSIKKLLEEKSDSLLSVQLNKHFLWKKEKGEVIPMNYDFLNRPRRQDRDLEFLENGSIYITKYSILLEQNSRLGGKISYYLMSEDKSYEIDTKTDWEILEVLMLKRRKFESRKNW